MVRQLRHSVAVNPRERAEMNALLEATDQKDAPRVRAMIEGAANPDAVVDNAYPPRTPKRSGRDWDEALGDELLTSALRCTVAPRGRPRGRVPTRVVVLRRTHKRSKYLFYLEDSK